MGYLPARPGMGYPPCPDLRSGTPPASVDRHTDSCQNTTFPHTMYTGGNNKKVLLCECKRHTAHCIASTCCAALSNPDLVMGGYPVPGPGEPCPRSKGGTPSQVWGGTPSPPSSRPGQGGIHGTPSTWTWDGVPPYLDLGWGTPLPGPGMGYPPYLDLRWGTPSPPPSVDRLKI